MLKSSKCIAFWQCTYCILTFGDMPFCNGRAEKVKAMKHANHTKQFLSPSSWKIWAKQLPKINLSFIMSAAHYRRHERMVAVLHPSTKRCSTAGKESEKVKVDHILRWICWNVVFWAAEQLYTPCWKHNVKLNFHDCSESDVKQYSFTVSKRKM